MSKPTKSTHKPTAHKSSATASSGNPPEEKPAASRSGTLRETVESIVVAFILAFLFRTFEAEAFVIPTGSMAPTLQGRHKDFECPQCGYRYRTSASGEVEDEEGVELPFRAARPTTRLQDRLVKSTTCPMCRFSYESADEETSYNGDRILVAKFPFDFQDPERWDVVVFKYPGDAKTNYIKRLVGLPGETVRIYRGDIYVRQDGDADFTIQRKSPRKLRAMLQLVHDNDYLVDEHIASGRWPPRWQPDSGDWQEANGWHSPDNTRTYSIESANAEPRWIRYRHLVPSWRDWQAMTSGKAAAGGESLRAKPQLVSDFYAYNTGQSRAAYRFDPRPDFATLGLHWVGDLALECELEVKQDRGEILLELVEGGVPFRCRINLPSGQATLSIGGQPQFQPRAVTDIRGSGTYDLRFANVDDALYLWVDGDVIEFDAPTHYDQFALDNKLPRAEPGQPSDLAPVGIGAQGTSIAVKHLKVFRDIYYIAGRHGNFITDYNYRVGTFSGLTSEDLAIRMSTPEYWPEMMGGVNGAEFPLGDDRFFVLGDNSPFSKDGRLWGHEYFVDRHLLTGKALFIYWPHSDHRIPGTPIPFPFFPNIPRMGFVR